MVALLLISLPFALISARWHRGWTLLLPLAFWGGLTVLQAIGLLTVFSGSGVVWCVALGTLFAALGYVGGGLARPRAA